MFNFLRRSQQPRESLASGGAKEGTKGGAKEASNAMATAAAAAPAPSSPQPHPHSHPRPPPPPVPPHLPPEAERRALDAERWAIATDLQTLEAQRRSMEADRQSLAAQRKSLEAQLRSFDLDKRNLVVQEQRFREQLTELAAKVAAREAESTELRELSDKLHTEVEDKTTVMHRLTAELESANKQSELLRQKLRQLEEDIAGFKRCNAQLAAELAAKAGEEPEAEQAQRKQRQAELEAELERTRERATDRDTRANQLAQEVARLEADLTAIKAERDALDAQLRELHAERQEEMEIVQKALDEAQEERDAAQRRFEQDFERLRTVNTDREQQMLEDFEWKLREVQQTCKKRLEEKDRTVEQRVAAARAELTEKLEAAERRVADVYDSQRALRSATRDLERAQLNESKLKEEVTRLKGVVESERSYAASVQRNYDRHVTESERKLNIRLMEQRDEFTVQWEEKLRNECTRLRSELQQIHAEEIALAVQAVREERTRENTAKLQALEKRLQNALNEVSALRARMAEKEAQHESDLQNAQTESDVSLVELRRKLDKLDMQYQEKIEKIQEQHEQQIEKLTEEADKRIQHVEQTWQMQVSSTRATLELVKEQLERDAQDRLEALERQHQQKLEEQWERLTRERETALEDAEEKHRAHLEKLRKDLEYAAKDHTIKETETAVTFIKEVPPLVLTTVIQSGESPFIFKDGVGGSSEINDQFAEQCRTASGRSAGVELRTNQSNKTCNPDPGASQTEVEGAGETAAGGEQSRISQDVCIAFSREDSMAGREEPVATGERSVAGKVEICGDRNAYEHKQSDGQSARGTKSAKRRGRTANQGTGNTACHPNGRETILQTGANQQRSHVQSIHGRAARRGRHRPSVTSSQGGRGSRTHSTRGSGGARSFRPSGPGPGSNSSARCAGQ